MMQAEMAKLGIDDKDSGSTLRKKAGRFKGKGKAGGWSTIRNQFKRDQTTVDATAVIGIPTLVKTTTERTDGARVAPPVAKKIQGPPSFAVPNKPLPKAPGTRVVPNALKSTNSTDFFSRTAPAAPPRANKRNTWMPQSSPSDFSKQVAAAGADGSPLIMQRSRGRGRGLGTGPANANAARGRQRPMSVRPPGRGAPRGRAAPPPNTRKRSLPQVPPRGAGSSV